MTQSDSLQIVPRVSVVMDPAAFYRNDADEVMGPIRLRFEGAPGVPTDFPAADWVDCAVTVLNECLRHLDALSSDVTDRAQCGFWKGPFAFSMARANASTYSVRCLKKSRVFSRLTKKLAAPEVLAKWTTPSSDFEASLLAAAQGALAECHRRGWTDWEIESLREAINARTRGPEDPGGEQRKNEDGLIRCRMAACREQRTDGEAWSFYLINDGAAPLDSAALYRVDSEWGDASDSVTTDVHVTGLAPGAPVRVWRDDGELRMELWVAVRSADREVRMSFEFPKLYTRRDLDLPVVGVLGRRGWEVAAEG